MSRRMQKPCSKCAGRQIRRGMPILSPHLLRDIIEYCRAHQAALGNRTQVAGRPNLIGNSCNSAKATLNTATDEANTTGTKPRPVVQLPHGLGTVTVPQGAHRVDVHFNCVTSKLPTEQLKDSLVVNVDVVYNTGCGPNGTSTTSTATATTPVPVKTEG